MFAVIALLTITLLARAFRSIVLAVKAVLLNLISMAAAFGVITWFWQLGHGSSPVFGIPATGAITFRIPLMVFALLFGLSMDYEVFILARVREEYDRTGSTDEVVVEGLGRTGRLVTSAALILFLLFASLASAPKHRRQGARHWVGRRPPARRDARPGVARAGARVPARTLELVVPAPGGPRVAGHAAWPAGRRSRGRASRARAGRAQRGRAGRA